MSSMNTRRKSDEFNSTKVPKKKTKNVSVGTEGLYDITMDLSNDSLSRDASHIKENMNESNIKLENVRADDSLGSSSTGSDSTGEQKSLSLIELCARNRNVCNSGSSDSENEQNVIKDINKEEGEGGENENKEIGELNSNVHEHDADDEQMESTDKDECEDDFSKDVKGKISKTELWDFYEIDRDEVLPFPKRTSLDHLIFPDDYKKLYIERRVLIGPYKFKIVGNESKYGSLYRAIAKAVYNKESEYEKVRKNIIEEMEFNWIHYKELCEKDTTEILSPGTKLQKTNPYYLQKSYFTRSRSRSSVLPFMFLELHAAASHYGFFCTLFDTVKDNTRVYPFFCNDKVNRVPVSDVTYFFLRSGKDITDWNYEFLIPIGTTGPIPQREIQVKFRNSVLVHTISEPTNRYPLEEECCETKHKKPSKWCSLLRHFRINWPISRKSRKVHSVVHTSVTTHDGHSKSLSGDAEKVYEEDVESTSAIKSEVKATKELREKPPQSLIKEIKAPKDFRIPSNRLNIHQLAYHNRLKLDFGLYYRNFLVCRTKTHDLFSLLSELMFGKLRNVDKIRNQVNNDIRKFSYIHLVSKTRRKEALLNQKPDPNHKNFEKLFSKPLDFGNPRDLESAAHYFEFSYILIGSDSNYNFYWKESKCKKTGDNVPFLAFFLYSYYKSGVPMRKWYYLSEEQSSFRDYQLYFGGTTMDKLREWNCHLYVHPRLTQYTHLFGRRSFCSMLRENICRIKSKVPLILHYVIPVDTPKDAFRLDTNQTTGAVIDKLITDNGAKNTQRHRLSMTGRYHFVRVNVNKLSDWANLWSMKNKPQFGIQFGNVSSWIAPNAAGLWHSLNPSPMISTASSMLLKLLERQIQQLLSSARKLAEFEGSSPHVCPKPGKQSPNGYPNPEAYSEESSSDVYSGDECQSYSNYSNSQ